MSDIALYNLLKRIPDATNDEVEKAIADVANTKEVATKDYIDAAIAKLETRITWRLVIVLGIYTAIISFITKAL